MEQLSKSNVKRKYTNGHRGNTTTTQYRMDNHNDKITSRDKQKRKRKKRCEKTKENQEKT